MNGTQIALHIGTEKTGTTYLQELLAINRAELARDGVLYPASPGDRNHLLLYFFAQDESIVDDIKETHGFATLGRIDRLRSDLLLNLQQEVQAIKPRKVVLSNEHCSSRLIKTESIARLRDLLLHISDDIRIIVYLRPQEAMFLSTYSQTIKSGSIGSIGDWYFECTQGGSYALLDYASLIKRWASVFGDSAIKVRIFDPTRLLHGRLEVDFFSVIEEPFKASYVVPSRNNESLDGACLEFLRRLNFVWKPIEGDTFNLRRARLVEALERISSKNANVSVSAEEIRKVFRESNRSVAKFLNVPEESLFPPPKIVAPDSQVKVAGVEENFWVHIVKEIWPG